MINLNRLVIPIRIVFWLFFIFITYKFLTPSPDTGIEIPNLDKIAHFGIFWILTSLAYFSYKINTKLQILIWTLYGLAIEFLQGLTPTRSPEFLDFIADMIGVLAALLILRWLNRFELFKQFQSENRHDKYHN